MKAGRRRFLQVGGFGAVMLTVGGVGLALQSTSQRAPRTPLAALDATAFSVLAAVADTVCPGGDDLPDSWTLMVPEKVDAQLASMHSANAAEVRQALMLLENGLAGLLFDGRPSTFTSCGPQRRAEVLSRWQTSRIGVRRTAYKALVGLISAAYWAQPETFAFVGYPGPPRFP